MAERTAGTAVLPTAEDTAALGARLGAELRAGDVVVLSLHFLIFPLKSSLVIIAVKSWG